MLRYTVLRTLVFFGCLAVAWLLGLRGQQNVVALVLVAALASMLISFFALRPFRQAYSAELAAKLEARAEAKKHHHNTDESAEDAEDEAASSTSTTQDETYR